MRAAIWEKFGPFYLQVTLYAGLGVLTFLGRWAQGGDRPIAVPLRILYAAFTIGGLVVVWLGLIGNYRRIYLWVLRIAQRLRCRPMLGLCLIVVAGCGGGALTFVMIEGIGQGFAALVWGGAIDIVGFTGDNSRDVQGFFATLLWMSDLAMGLGAAAHAWWQLERRRLASIRRAAAETE